MRMPCRELARAPIHTVAGLPRTIAAAHGLLSTPAQHKGCNTRAATQGLPSHTCPAHTVAGRPRTWAAAQGLQHKGLPAHLPITPAGGRGAAGRAPHPTHSRSRSRSRPWLHLAAVPPTPLAAVPSHAIGCSTAFQLRAHLHVHLHVYLHAHLRTPACRPPARRPPDPNAHIQWRVLAAAGVSRSPTMACACSQACRLWTS